MSLQQTIHDEMVTAMKAKEETRLSVLRGLVSAFTAELTATKRTPQDELADDEAMNVIRRALKQRKDAAEQFTKGGREELAANELAEAEILQTYLPAMLGTEEITKVVEEKKAALGMTDKSDIGKLMGAVMGELKGKADGADVKAAVEAALS